MIDDDGKQKVYSKLLPLDTPWILTVVAADRHIYLNIGKDYFKKIYHFIILIPMLSD